MSNEQGSDNIVAKTISFGRESWIELKKVQRPNRQETIQMTIIVIVMIFVFAAFLGLTDFLVGWLMKSILT